MEKVSKMDQYHCHILVGDTDDEINWEEFIIQAGIKYLFLICVNATITLGCI